MSSSRHFAKVVPLPRRHRRFPCSATVELHHGGTLHVGMCDEISVGGAYVRGVELPLGWVGDLTVFLDKRSLRVTAEICSHKPTMPAGRGLRFLRLDADAVSTLGVFLQGQPLTRPERISSAAA